MVRIHTQKMRKKRSGKPAMEAAEQIKAALKKYGYQLSLDTPTNQIFCIVSNDVMKEIAQDVEFGFWEKYDETHSVPQAGLLLWKIHRN